MRVSLEEIEARRPDVLLPPDPEFAAEYAERCAAGRVIASQCSVAFVAICRNAMPWLPRTLELLEQTGEMFGSWEAFIYENDSVDGTKETLLAWQDGNRRRVSINDHGRPHLNYTTAPVRTEALAEYRTQCQRFVMSGERVDLVVVFDTDPWGGWSIDGLANSVWWMCDRGSQCYEAACMASYSWCEWAAPVFAQPTPSHYDAFAARLNHWGQRDQLWFHLWRPPVGSPPVRMNSAFGQMALYRADYYSRGRYTGEDCEHVTFHRSMGGRLYLNPAMRCVSFWVPDEVKRGGQHGDD